ncbi:MULTISPECIES: protoporphyrinogen/coproporphyrinogen oxidase [Streptomyces]|uniref:protoporphyrinogen/coproporphyrinogen oxidase n=1 Tax=Streptomyces TaxID=1883 RepID=UPI003682303D
MGSIPHSASFPASGPGAQRKVVVVGAGIAGLSAAYRLQEAGCEVVVLEKTHHVGGRMRTEEKEGYRIDVGAAMLPDTYREMRGLIHDIGMTNQIVPSGDVYGLLRKGRVHRIGRNVGRDLLRTGLLSICGKLRLLRLVADAGRVGGRLNFRDLSEAYEADEACTAYSSRRLSREIFDYVIEPLCTNYFFSAPEELSMAHIFPAVRETIGTGYFSSPAGVGFLPRGLAERLDIRFGTPVTLLEEHRDGVTVTVEGPDGRQRRETAPACVLAVTGASVPEVWPGVPAGMRTYLSRLRYATCVHVSFGISSRPAEPAMWILVPRREFPGGMGVCLDHNRAPGRAPEGKGMISVYWATERSEEMYDLDDEEIVEAALRDLERVSLFPGVRNQVEMTHVSRCRPCVPLLHAGSIAELRNGLAGLPSTSRVALAGDFFAIGSTNAALTSGEAAASRVLALLDHTR